MKLQAPRLNTHLVLALVAVTMTSLPPLGAEEPMYCDFEYVLEVPDNGDRAQVRHANAFYDDFENSDRFKRRLRAYKAYLDYQQGEGPEARYPFDDEHPDDAHHSKKACVEVRGQGAIEVEVRLVGSLAQEAPPMPSLWFHTWAANVGFNPTTSFRWVIHETHQFGFRTAWNMQYMKRLFYEHIEGDSLEEADAILDGLESLEIVVTARRITEYCWMDAFVTGDVPRSQRFFGDGAYFNTAAYPVKKGMMVGTIGETQTHEDVAGFGTVDVSREGALDLAARFGLISEEEAAEAAEDVEDEGVDQEEVPAESGGFAEWAEQQLRAENPEDGDNFGLNLADIKADVTPKTDEGAAAMFAGAFTMSISGRVGQAKDQQRIAVVPSLVMATVGLSEKGGDRISFELNESNPLSIDGVKVTDDFIIGTIKGELQTKGPYTLEGVTSKPRKLKIQVVAHFAALRGSLSCMQ